MKIKIRIENRDGHVAAATITTTTIDPAKEGSKVLLRLVRILEQQEVAKTYDFTLLHYGGRKIDAIKIYRNLTRASLPDARDAIEAGGRIARGLTATQIEPWIRGFEQIGAQFETPKVG
jgi:ribosomal protein L7/L12